MTGEDVESKNGPVVFPDVLDLDGRVELGHLLDALLQGRLQVGEVLC